MEVNKHINFLKRRGFLIKEDSQTEFDFGDLDSVEPQTKVKKSIKKKPKVNLGPELDLGVDRTDIRAVDDNNIINIRGLCNRAKQLDIKKNTDISDEDTYCKVLKKIDDSGLNYDDVMGSLDVIYHFFRPGNDNRTKFHSLINYITSDGGYMEINTIHLLAEYLNDLENGRVDGKRNQKTMNAIKKLRDEDTPIETLGELETLIKRVKTIKYSEYEESFDGEFFSLVRTGLSIDYKDPEDDTFTNQLHNLIINKTPKEEMVLELFDKILRKNTNLNEFIKADLITNVPIYSNIGGRVVPLIGKDQFIEVKKLDFDGDSYLSEFFAIYKNSKIGPWANNQKYFDLYNQVVDRLYELISKHDWGQKVLDAISRNFAGIIYKDGDRDRFIPSSEIELYWSNAGQRKCESERRLAIRYRVKSGAVDSYIVHHDDDTMDHEVVPVKSPVKSSDRIICPPYVTHGPNKETNYPGRINLGEASVNDKQGGEWDRDSTQGKMIRTKGGTKELDDDFDWAIQQAELTPDDPEVVALIQHLGIPSEVIGDDFDDYYGGWYGNHTVMKIQNGEEWVVGTETSMGNALYEYFDNYIEDVGYSELGIDLADYVDVSDYWIEQFCEEEAENYIDGLNDEDFLEQSDNDIEYEDINEREDELIDEIDEIKYVINNLQHRLNDMKTKNVEYLQFGLTEPPYDEETIDNSEYHVNGKQDELGELEEEYSSMSHKKETLIEDSTEYVKDGHYQMIMGCMRDPVDCMVNELGWYRTGSEAIESFGWDIDKESIIEYLSTDGYGAMSSYNDVYYEEYVDGETYILIRVN